MVHVINFQFTARDTAIIAGKLDEAEFELIEIGHGVGLGASEAGYGQAAETDEGYMEAAASAVKRAKWGMFCICLALQHSTMSIVPPDME